MNGLNGFRRMPNPGIYTLFLTCFALRAISQPLPSFRALQELPSGVIWASGTGATIMRSTDGGKSFATCQQPPDAGSLDFRGLYAWDAQRAMIMSSGTGPSSRLYETTDGCSTWKLVFSNPDPEGFWDGLVFSALDPNFGALLGDPVHGRLTIFFTTDRGRHWKRDESPALAARPAGEGAFAASNSSLAFLHGSRRLLFGTGGKAGPRIFRYDAGTQAWTVVSLPFAHPTDSAGIFSVACRTTNECMAVGGDYRHPAERSGTIFFSRDGGRTWTVPSALPRGYRSAVSWCEGWLVAGPTGVDFSPDNGASWSPVDNSAWNALSGFWAAGPQGRIAPLGLKPAASTRFAKPRSGQ